MKLPDELNDENTSHTVRLIANLITRVSLVARDITQIGGSMADDCRQRVAGGAVA
jgi:hypothetical protein